MILGLLTPEWGPPLTLGIYHGPLLEGEIKLIGHASMVKFLDYFGADKTEPKARTSFDCFLPAHRMKSIVCGVGIMGM